MLKHYIRMMYPVIPFILVLLLYSQVLSHGYVAFDDDIYIYNNPMVVRGLSWDGVLWAFSDYRVGNYHPLTWISYFIDYELFGNNSGAFAFVNAIIHALNSALVSMLIFYVIGSRMHAVVFGMVFAGHPVLIESVAWISQRKSVLATLFVLLCILLYLEASRKCSISKRIVYYLLSLLMYLMSLLSKGMYVTLPVLLVLIEMIRICGQKNLFENNRFGFYNVDAKSVAFRSLPYLLLSILFCFITYFSQVSGGAVASIEAVPLIGRIQNVFYGYSWHLFHFIHPIDLSFFYPYIDNIDVVVTGAQCLLLATVTVGFYVFRSLISYRPFIGWLFFLICLVPVIGIVHIGSHVYADRYMYGPIIGLLFVFSGITEAFYKHRFKRLIWYFWIVWISFLSFSSWQYIRNWKDSISLAEDAYISGIRHPAVYCVLANGLRERGDYLQSRDVLMKGLESSPFDATLLNGLALTESYFGNYSVAVDLLEKSVSIEPKSGVGLTLLALMYYEIDRIEDAALTASRARNIKDLGYSELFFLDALDENIRESLQEAPTE